MPMQAEGFNGILLKVVLKVGCHIAPTSGSGKLQCWRLWCYNMETALAQCMSECQKLVKVINVPASHMGISWVVYQHLTPHKLSDTSSVF